MRNVILFTFAFLVGTTTFWLLDEREPAHIAGWAMASTIGFGVFLKELLEEFAQLLNRDAKVATEKD